MRVGALDLAGSLRGFRGSIDEVRWWQGARSRDMIWETLTERLSGAESMLKGMCVYACMCVCGGGKVLQVEI
jgi:hypothetical protein